MSRDKIIKHFGVLLHEIQEQTFFFIDFQGFWNSICCNKRNKRSYTKKTYKNIPNTKEIAYHFQLFNKKLKHFKDVFQRN